ncbi:hypothetical protein B0A48_17285 [Cryoendolithus antarcticus]|uniref:Uncharacterized protein n=1 Tax=Cryoendolithus antarcticus TaxID=1507870 RepID=A0A1V8SBT8_9PEZI|nr:hypothetical protein B0A48_17285 [Cryoendolithus antarcticus]
MVATLSQARLDGHETSAPATASASKVCTSLRDLPYDILHQIVRHLAESQIHGGFDCPWLPPKYTYSLMETLHVMRIILKPLRAHEDLYLLGVDAFCCSHAVRMTPTRLALLLFDPAAPRLYGDLFRVVRNLELDLDLYDLKYAEKVLRIGQLRKLFPRLRLIHIRVTWKVLTSQQLVHPFFAELAAFETFGEVSTSLQSVVDQLRHLISSNVGTKIKMHLSQLGFGRVTTITDVSRSSSRDVASAFLEDVAGNETWHVYSI